VATEKVVEYYFPDEKMRSINDLRDGKQKRKSTGEATKTTAETLSENSLMSKLKKSFKKLDL
jgi:hypothetical protein